MTNPFGDDFTVPNLDDFSDDPETIYQASRVFESLFEYLDCRYRAVLARRDGIIPEAQDYEQDAQNIYRKLPEWARW